MNLVQVIYQLPLVKIKVYIKSHFVGNLFTSKQLINNFDFVKKDTSILNNIDIKDSKLKFLESSKSKNII